MKFPVDKTIVFSFKSSCDILVFCVFEFVYHCPEENSMNLKPCGCSKTEFRRVFNILIVFIVKMFAKFIVLKRPNFRQLLSRGYRRLMRLKEEKDSKHSPGEKQNDLNARSKTKLKSILAVVENGMLKQRKAFTDLRIITLSKQTSLTEIICKSFVYRFSAREGVLSKITHD